MRQPRIPTKPTSKRWKVNPGPRLGCCAFPAGVAGKLKNLIDLNKHQNKKYDLAHPEFGIDLSILFDPNAKGTQAEWKKLKEVLVEEKEGKEQESKKKKSKYYAWKNNTRLTYCKAS